MCPPNSTVSGGSFTMFLEGQKINSDSEKNGERNILIPRAKGGCGFLTTAVYRMW